MTLILFGGFHELSNSSFTVLCYRDEIHPCGIGRNIKGNKNIISFGRKNKKEVLMIPYPETNHKDLPISEINAQSASFEEAKSVFYDDFARIFYDLFTQTMKKGN
jgi:hypothetical protein